MSNNKVAIIPYERYQSLIRSSQNIPEVQRGSGIKKSSNVKEDIREFNIKQPPPGIPTIQATETLDSDNELEELEDTVIGNPQAGLLERKKQGSNWRSKWLAL